MRRPLWSGAETRSECAGQRQAGWPQGAAPGRPALVPWGASVACAAWIPPCYTSLRYVQLFWGRPGRGRPDDVYLPGLYRFRPRKRKRRILLRNIIINGARKPLYRAARRGACQCRLVRARNPSHVLSCECTRLDNMVGHANRFRVGRVTCRRRPNLKSKDPIKIKLSMTGGQYRRTCCPE